MEINARYKSFCNTCQFTIFQNEKVWYTNNKVHHLNCLDALKDRFPRYMSTANQNLYGKVQRTKLAEQLKKNGYKPFKTLSTNNYKHSANRGVRLIS